jgi:HNH endonuclease
MITHERLLAIVTYDPDTGLFAWKARPRVKAGKLAGHLAAHGYVTLRLDGLPYYAHRVAWFYVTGEWPAAEIDHIDRNGLNNRFANLRLADRTQNVVNRARRRDNTSGFKGVYVTRGGRFMAQHTIKGKAHYLGTFDTAEEAFAARNAYLEKRYGEYYASE